MKRLLIIATLLLTATAVWGEEAANPPPAFAPPWCEGEQNPIACARQAWEETADTRKRAAELMDEVCDEACRKEKAQQAKEAAADAAEAGTRAVDKFLRWGAGRAAKTKRAWEDARQEK